MYACVRLCVRASIRGLTFFPSLSLSLSLFLKVVAILVGARNADHVADHQALGSFALDAGDLSAIQAALDAGAKAQGDVYDWERGGAGWAA